MISPGFRLNLVPKRFLISVFFVILLLLSPMYSSRSTGLTFDSSPAGIPIRVLIVTSSNWENQSASTMYYWLNQIWKIPCDLIPSTAITNNTIFNSDNSLKYFCVIWTANYYYSNDAKAMQAWNEIIPQLYTYVAETSLSVSISDEVFGAHFYNDIKIDLNSSNVFLPDDMTIGVSGNFVGINAYPFRVSNLTLGLEGNAFYIVDGNVLGARQGKNVIAPFLAQIAVSPDNCYRYNPFVYTMLFNFLKLEFGFIPAIIPNKILANIRVDDVFWKTAYYMKVHLIPFHILKVSSMISMLTMLKLQSEL